MQRHQHFHQKVLMLFFQRKCKAINNTTKTKKKVNRNIHKQVKEIMSAIGPDECQVKVIVKVSTGCLGHLPLFFKMSLY